MSDEPRRQPIAMDALSLVADLPRVVQAIEKIAVTLSHISVNLDHINKALQTLAERPIAPLDPTARDLLERMVAAGESLADRRQSE